MKAYLIISGSLFTLIALLHFARLLQHWPAVVAAWAVPVWASGLGLIIASSPIRRPTVPSQHRTPSARCMTFDTPMRVGPNHGDRRARSRPLRVSFDPEPRRLDSSAGRSGDQPDSSWRCRVRSMLSVLTADCYLAPASPFQPSNFRCIFGAGKKSGRSGLLSLRPRVTPNCTRAPLTLCPNCAGRWLCRDRRGLRRARHHVLADLAIIGGRA
jgi:hypothetical protein